MQDLHPFRRLPIRRLSIGRLINIHIRVITCARARRSATTEFERHYVPSLAANPPAY